MINMSNIRGSPVVIREKYGFWYKKWHGTQFPNY